MATFKDKITHWKIILLNIKELIYLTQLVDALNEGEKQTQADDENKF